MPAHLTETGTQYSTGVGLIYVFNLIVGTGALTMPAAFQQAGWALSLVLVVFLGFTSFLTVTFVIEAMAVANAKIKENKRLMVQSSEYSGTSNSEGNSEVDPLLQESSYQTAPADEEDTSLHVRSRHFEITERVELGTMAGMFFNKVGETLFYLCIIIYLYGDLAIYAAAVPKSIRDVACTYRSNGTKCNETIGDAELCWASTSVTRGDAYRIFVAGFFVLLGPFTFFNVQKTKYLQMFTSFTRWTSFGLMIILAIIHLARGKGEGHPVVADVSGVPNLFGVCVYSFMCHHSLPSLVTPIKDKNRLASVLLADFLIILAFYALLSFTGIYTFGKIQDLYTLNFFNIYGCDETSVTSIKFFEYFLALFPVFTLSTNFPIISITLRNNVQTMMAKGFGVQSWKAHHIVFPLMAIIPPTAVAFATSEVEFLVGITGSYAGAGIQYVIPVFLVYVARKDAVLTSGHNKHGSWFKGPVWVILVLVWAIVCIAFVTVNHIVTGK